MNEESRDAAEDQGQMKDQETFSEDPRGGKELSEQQGESQPAGGRSGSDDSADSEDEQGQVGRDDPGQATGNPAGAG
jgi:hypothetical protein